MQLFQNCMKKHVIISAQEVRGLASQIFMSQTLLTGILAAQLIAYMVTSECNIMPS